MSDKWRGLCRRNLKIMKRMKLLILIILFSLKVFAPQDKVLYVLESPVINPYLDIWEAVISVESGGDPFAIGDKHLNEFSYGIAQIRRVRIEDYNRRTGKNYTLIDVFDVEVSREIFMFFADRYGPYNIDYAVKRWNGSGPKTVEYLNRVKSKL